MFDAGMMRAWYIRVHDTGVLFAWRWLCALRSMHGWCSGCRDTASSTLVSGSPATIKLERGEQLMHFILCSIGPVTNQIPSKSGYLCRILTTISYCNYMVYYAYYAFGFDQSGDNYMYMP